MRSVKQNTHVLAVVLLDLNSKPDSSTTSLTGQTMMHLLEQKPSVTMLFFAQKDTPISVDDIAGWLQDALVDAEIESEDEQSPGDWSTMTLFLDGGTPVVEIEKFSRQDESLTEKVEDTVRFLLDEANNVRPDSAVKWLCQFMSRVNVLYEFRPLEAMESKDGWKIFNEVWTNLRRTLKGIVYLDEEGFTNEDGAQITLANPAEGKGDLKVAVLEDNGEGWIEFVIDLANQEQKELFMAGKVPGNARKSPS